MTCPNCHQDVPAAAFCIRCGEPLENRDSPYPIEGRGYPAAPDEHWLWPRIVSSLYPQLPRTGMATFRVALALGTALVLTLALGRLFPLALVVAAALVPFLTILYLWQVDVYEDEPLPALALTIGWGAGAGVGLGFAVRAITSDTSLLSGTVTAHDLVWLGVILPLGSGALMLAGPLTLLPYRRFNDVLDGATFGTACAVTLLGAEVITNSADFLSQGLKAAGDVSEWIARLLTLGIAVPVVGAAATGAATGALWLRYRAPAKDRRALGILGSPLVAVAFQAAALVGASIVQLYLSAWWALLAVGAVAVAALVALRRVIYVGLIEEAAEIEIGPPVQCPNCGRETPTHSFCAHCGVALRALPKGRPAGEAPARSRLSRPAALAVFATLVAASAGLTVAAIVLAEPTPIHPPCAALRPCASPPQEPQPPRVRRSSPAPAHAKPLLGGTRWQSRVGPWLRYQPKLWSVVASTRTTLELRSTKDTGGMVVRVVVRPSPGSSPQSLLDSEVARARRRYLGLTADHAQTHVLLNPILGYRHGVGGMYHTATRGPPSPAARIELAFQAASLGRATMLVQAVTREGAKLAAAGHSAPFPSLGLVDELLYSVEWRRR